MPSLHRKYIASMVDMFGDSALHSVTTLQQAIQVSSLTAQHKGRDKGSCRHTSSLRGLVLDDCKACIAGLTIDVLTHFQAGKSVEMENFFSRLTLDIIGKAVFNYDFDSLTHDDPVIKARLPPAYDYFSRCLPCQMDFCKCCPWCFHGQIWCWSLAMGILCVSCLMEMKP